MLSILEGIFGYRKQLNDMDSKKKKRRKQPKLERRYAAKNFNYDASPDILPRLKLPDFNEEKENDEIKEAECQIMVPIWGSDESSPIGTSGCCGGGEGRASVRGFDEVSGCYNGSEYRVLTEGLDFARICYTSSTWDLMRDFAPKGKGGGKESYVELCASYDEQEEDEEEGEVVVEEREVDGVRLKREEEENVEIIRCFSRSSSFTTSTSHEGPRSNRTSPNRRVKPVITPGSWQKGGLLGRGSFGSVFEGISKDGTVFAVKEVSLLDQGSQGKQSVFQLEQEIALLSQFEHENIVHYIGTEMDESKLYIFIELVTKGSLRRIYTRYTLRDSQVSAYTRTILHGLKYLHDQYVVHRDIRCANILVHASGSVKLADFGLAKETKLNDLISCEGTARWMAPEVVKRRGFGLPADVWSLGCTVLEMLTGQIPYSNFEPMQALFRIGKGERPSIPDSLSRDAHDFILQCLQVNPDDRPTAAQLLNHPFVQRPISQSSFPLNIHGRKG